MMIFNINPLHCNIFDNIKIIINRTTVFNSLNEDKYIILYLIITWIFIFTLFYLNNKVNYKYVFIFIIEIIFTIIAGLILVLAVYPVFNLFFSSCPCGGAIQLMDDTVDITLPHPIGIESNYKLDFEYTEFLISNDDSLININMDDNTIIREHKVPSVQGPGHTTSNETLIDLRCLNMPRFMINDHTSVKNFVYDCNDYNLEYIRKITNRVRYETVELPKGNEICNVTGFRRSKIIGEESVEVLFSKKEVDGLGLRDRILVEGRHVTLTDFSEKNYKVIVPIKNN